ncbi:hypothetical protein EV144_104172 [Flavobacterium sp. 270]|uniref:hypothetical protein n=1 Tax=Flavobacterium sp. 270 TaxID=2512114 RepID=UPI001067002E|nr:hypothetical protein [Flavobacterium sp. 270]TDW47886.1 hypothetical protein EV144_104172 [Flavobacterium sp. 270]
MKKIFLYILMIIAFCNCQNKKEKTGLSSEEIKDINDIVEAIIIQDSLDVFYKSEDSTAFCAELRKLNIYIPEMTKEGNIIPPPPQDIYITQILSNEIDRNTFFTSKDSLYLLKQNSNPDKLEINKALKNKLNTTTFAKAVIKRKKVDNYGFYNMTIPIFSLDRQNSYIQLEYHCSGLCGHGNAFYLKKNKGKWKIVRKRETWIS